MQGILAIEELLQMAPSDAQFQDLKKRVTDLEGKSNSSPTTSWPQRHPLFAWLVGFTAPGIAIIIAFYGSVMPHIERHLDDQVQIKVNDGLKQPLQKMEQMSNDIQAIKTTLSDWEIFVLPQILKQSSSLSREQFEKSLPRLKNAIGLATESKVKVANETLQQISQKLQQVSESSPEYWPTVLQFIQFASASMVAPSDIPPPSASYNTMSNVRCIGIAHCIKASHVAILLDGGDIHGSIFDHWRIKFTNSPVGLKGVKFIDCVFEMPTEGVPTPYLQKSAKILLASNLSTVSFPPQ